jgi:hypothetical protein
MIWEGNGEFVTSHWQGHINSSDWKENTLSRTYKVWCRNKTEAYITEDFSLGYWLGNGTINQNWDYRRNWNSSGWS